MKLREFSGKRYPPRLDRVVVACRARSAAHPRRRRSLRSSGARRSKIRGPAVTRLVILCSIDLSFGETMTYGSSVFFLYVNCTSECFIRGCGGSMSTLFLLFVSSVQLGGFLFVLGEMCSIGGFRWSMVDFVYASCTGLVILCYFLLNHTESSERSAT